VAFLQVWEAASADAQDGWLCEMRANIGLLQVKPGFVSMVLHRSPDQKNLCVTHNGRISITSNQPSRIRS
jgi:hypothetical protein